MACNIVSVAATVPDPDTYPVITFPITEALSSVTTPVFDMLVSEEYVLKAEKAVLSEIEKINSSFPYNFELIELIAE